MSTSSQPKVETAGLAGRFSPDDLAQKTRESRAYWNSPQGKQRRAQLDAEQRNRKPAPARFPQAQGLKPVLSTSSKIAIASAKGRK